MRVFPGATIVPTMRSQKHKETGAKLQNLNGLEEVVLDDESYPMIHRHREFVLLNAPRGLAWGLFNPCIRRTFMRENFTQRAPV